MKHKHHFRLFSLTLTILLALSACTSPSVKETESESQTETVTADVQTPPKESKSVETDSTEESGETESQTNQEEIKDIFVESGQRYPIELNTNYHVPLGNGSVVINAGMYYTQLGTEEYRIYQDDMYFDEWFDDCFFLEEVFGPENGWFLWSWRGKPYDRFTPLSVNYIKEPDSYGPGFWRPYGDLMLEGAGFLNLVVDYERVASGGSLFEVNGDLYDLYIHNHGGVWNLSLPNPVQLYEQAGDLNYLVGREAAKDITAKIVSPELPIPADRQIGIDEFELYHSPQDEAPFVSYPVHSVYEEDKLYFKTLYCFVENEGRWNNDGDWIHVTMEDGTEGWAKGWQLCGTTGEPPRDETGGIETPLESQTDETQDVAPAVPEETPVPTLTPTVTPGLSGGGSLISRGRYIMLDGSLMWVSEKMDSKEDYSDYVLGTAEYIVGDKDNIPEEDGKTNYRAYAGAEYAFKDGNWYLYTDGSWCRLVTQ